MPAALTKTSAFQAGDKQNEVNVHVYSREQERSVSTNTEPDSACPRLGTFAHRVVDEV